MVVTDDVPVPVDACNTLFKTVCGMTNIVLCKSVWERAAVDELLGPEGAGKTRAREPSFTFSLRQLTPHERFPFSDPMEDLLATTVSTQERWVSLTEAYLRYATQVRKRLFT
jgi:hypothetical protein